VDQVVARAAENFGVRIIILEADGSPLVDSAAGAAPALPERLTQARLLQDPESSVPQFIDSQRQTWIYTARRLENERILVVLTPRPRVTWRVILRDEFFNPLLIAALSALVLSLLLAAWVSGWIARPLEKMAQAARRGQDTRFAPDGRDPLEVQELAQALEEMRKQVQASQEAQRSFVANVSHDLKTPLTSIQGFAQAILDGTAQSPEAVQQSAQVIHTEAERMHRMVQDLLELARLDAGIAGLERLPVDLSAMLHELILRLKPQLAQAQLSLESDLPALPPILGDRARLERVFANLLDNAIKFTPPGGRLRLELRAAEGWAQVKVGDSGPGIPAEALEQIFKRFYQVDPSRPGSRSGHGLGLAIGREIVLAHGGEISVKNHTGAPGCTFTVKLPVARPDDETLACKRSAVKDGKR
jgi:signal transduction histidine kinase